MHVLDNEKINETEKTLTKLSKLNARCTKYFGLIF